MNQFDIINNLEPTTKDGRNFKTAVLSVFQDFQQKVENMFGSLRQEFVDLCDKQDQAIQQLSSEVVLLKRQVAKLDEKIDEQEAYERRDTLVLSGEGIPIHSLGENCISVAKKVIQNELKLLIPESDISVCHRLGRKPTNQTQDKRSLIIKFCRRDAKHDVLVASRRVKSKKLFANESLTPVRQSILYALRRAKRELPNIVTGTTTSNGSVFVFVKAAVEGGRDARIQINSSEKLENFCVTTLGKSVNHFFPNGFPLK